MTITLDKSRAGIQGGGPGSGGGHLSDGERYFGVRWHNANVPTSSGGRDEFIIQVFCLDKFAKI